MRGRRDEGKVELTGQVLVYSLCTSCAEITKILPATFGTHLQVSVAMELTQGWEEREGVRERGRVREEVIDDQLLIAPTTLG